MSPGGLIEFFSSSVKALIAALAALLLTGATFFGYPPIAPAIVFGLWLYAMLRILR